MKYWFVIANDSRYKGMQFLFDYVLKAILPTFKFLFPLHFLLFCFILVLFRLGAAPKPYDGWENPARLYTIINLMAVMTSLLT